VTGEGSWGAASKQLGMTFFPGLNPATEDRLLDAKDDFLSLIPARTKITSIWIFGQP
jgi:hypothetical protein